MQVKERVKDSMYALGMPITQGAITTILGVIGLGLAPSYIFVTFFKMVLLVIVLGKWSLFYLCLLIVFYKVYTHTNTHRKDLSTYELKKNYEKRCNLK